MSKGLSDAIARATAQVQLLRDTASRERQRLEDMRIEDLAIAAMTARDQRPNLGKSERGEAIKRQSRIVHSASELLLDAERALSRLNDRARARSPGHKRRARR